MSNLSCICTICGTETLGAYCHTCGQQNTGKRLTLKSILEDLLSNLFSVEKSGFATLLKLITKPATVIESYWNGLRGYYQAPSKLFVFATILMGLHIYYNENTVFGLQFTDSPKVFFLVFFFLFFTASSYFTYFKKKHSLLEHCILNAYLLCSYLIVFVVLYEAIKFVIDENIYLSLLITLTLFLAIPLGTSTVFLQKSKKIKMFLYSLLQLLIFSLLITLFFGIASIFSNLNITY